MKRVLLRADGGPVLGWGHVMRCRSLALELRRLGWDPLFYGTVDPSPGPLVDESGQALPRVPVDQGWGEDPGRGSDTLRVARERRVKAVVVDSYEFRCEDFRVLTGAGFPVIAIDDLGNRDLPVDMVVNPNPLVTPAMYKGQNIPCVLTGEMFTLIRPEVLALPRAGGWREAGAVLVTLGGGDVADLMRQVLRAIPADLDRPVVASVSPACPRRLLEIWAQTAPSHRALSHDPGMLPDLMAQAGLAVTGGGTTLWELYYLGVPGIVLAWVANQKQTAAVIRKRQTSLLLDIQAGFRPDPFREALHRLLTEPGLGEKMIERQHALIDGQGTRRVAEAIDLRYER